MAFQSSSPKTHLRKFSCASFIFVFYLLFPLSGFGQVMFYSDMFTNSKLRLTLSSNNEFDLTMYFDCSADYDSEMICWAKGSVIYKNDTIVCMDLQTSKKIIFIRMLHNDIIKRYVGMIIRLIIIVARRMIGKRFTFLI